MFRQQLKLLPYGSQLESYVSVLCRWFVVFRHSLNLQNLVSSTKYIFTPLVYHTKNKSRLFTLISSLRLLLYNLLSFGSLGTEINKSKSVAFAAHSNYNFQTQESINILKTKQNKTQFIRINYDFASSNENSNELWTKRRHEIKQKRILAKTVTWLLDNPNIIETKRFGQN